MKVFKKKSNVFLALGGFFLLSFLGFVGVFLMDADGSIDPSFWAKRVMGKVLELLYIKRINITATLFFSVAVAYAATAFAVVVLLAKRAIRKFLVNKGMQEKLSETVIYSVSGGAGLLGWLVSIAFCAIRGAKLSHFFLICLYLLVSLVVMAVGIIVLYCLIMILSRAIKTSSARGVTGGAGESVGAAQGEDHEVFPDLKRIDDIYKEKTAETVTENPPCTLSQFAEGFQAFLAEKCNLYYDLKMLRSFVAGLSTSRLIILEGLSGTGKSSLPRYFSEYVGCKTFFAPVQSTWRDRTDLLGFYNDFSGVFKETNFLKKLYEASYTPNEFNIMVLDEMNLSRVEYYFADFLSVLEYPAEDWKVTLMSAVKTEDAPAKIKNGAVVIPVNTWFVGTANKDDSTFTITDKVYDRAVVLDFNERNSKIATTASPEPISLTPGQLTQLFATALEREELRLTQADLQKFEELAEFVYEQFEIRFGNRIMNQITTFVPVYVALGGTKEEALDIMFARKVLHKLDGRFEDYIKDGLIRLQGKLAQTYGAGVLTETESAIKRLLKKLM